MLVWSLLRFPTYGSGKVGKKIPLDRLLLETDRTAENAAECPSVRDIAVAVATYRDLSFAELERITDDNAERFLNLI